MKNFIKYIIDDASNLFAFGALALFGILGVYFSVTEGFQDNAIWIYALIIVFIIWTIGNIVAYKKK